TDDLFENNLIEGNYYGILLYATGAIRGTRMLANIFVDDRQAVTAGPWFAGASVSDTLIENQVVSRAAGGLQFFPSLNTVVRSSSIWDSSEGVSTLPQTFDAGASSLFGTDTLVVGSRTAAFMLRGLSGWAITNIDLFNDAVEII